MAYYDIRSLLNAATGRWYEILTSAGIPASVLDGRNHPCPKCGGRDRFATFSDFSVRGAVHCRRCFTRGCAIRPGDGLATLRWWLDRDLHQTLEHLANHVGFNAPSSGRVNVDRPRSAAPPLTAMQMELSSDVIDGHTDFAKQAYRRMDDAARTRLATSMELAASALKRLRVGLTVDQTASTWPMRDEHMRIVGVAIRRLPGSDRPDRRWSRTGSQSGLFATHVKSRRDSRLFVTEGASDTAVASAMGLWVIGRAGCAASTHFVDRFLHTHRPSRVTIVADHDTPGLRGAKRLARDLAQQLPSTLSTVEVITPPENGMDLSDWVRSGATRRTILRNEPTLSLSAPRQHLLDFGGRSRRFESTSPD